MRELPWVGVMAALVLFAAGCADEPIRDDDGVVINAGAVSVFELEQGDCLDPAPDVTGDIDEIQVVPCDQPHLQEVYATVEHPDDAYPGASEVAAFADGACVAQLDEQLGLSLDDGVFFSYLLPSFDGWNTRDDREIICVLVFPDREAAIGSVVAGTLEIDRAEPAPPRPDEVPAPGDPSDDSADDPTDEPGDAPGDAVGTPGSEVAS